MKALSCGILVLNPQAELLLCHVTGAWHWDIPKGGLDPGETPLQAALRETREECGLDLSGEPLRELGRQPYRPDKALHLFACCLPRFDAARTCRCTSHFTDPFGRRRPEMDGFEWVPFSRVHRRCSRRMAELLGQTLSLPALLRELPAPDASRPVPGPPAPAAG